MTKRGKRIQDYAGRLVRLTDERWEHILKHPEMAGQRRKLREVLKAPERVFTSYRDPTVYFYYRFYARSPVGPKYLMAAVKILDSDAFVITAFFTDELRGARQIWGT